MDIPVVVNDLPLLIQDSISGCKFLYKDRFVENSFQANDWLEKICLTYGSTMQGRKDAFRKITNTLQKPGIYISETNDILYFPLLGEKSTNNIWIQYNQVVHYKSLQNKQTKIYFLNGEEYVINFDSRVVKTQISKCEQFLKMIHEK